jgi:hypothetical protein
MHRLRTIFSPRAGTLHVPPPVTRFFSTTTKKSNMASSGVPTSADPPAAKIEPTAAPLPKLSPAEFREYNRMAEHMDYFHSHFRSTWNVLYGACEEGKRPKGASIRQFIAMGQGFCQQLEVHHGIEEKYVYRSRDYRYPV